MSNWHERQSRRREALRREGEQRLRVVEAERRAVEVNARARDRLARGEFAAGLAEVDSVLDLVENPDLLANLLETKFDLLYNGRQRNEAYQVLLRLLKCRPQAAHYERAAGGLR